MFLSHILNHLKIKIIGCNKMNSRITIKSDLEQPSKIIFVDQYIKAYLTECAMIFQIQSNFTSRQTTL